MIVYYILSYDCTVVPLSLFAIAILEYYARKVPIVVSSNMNGICAIMQGTLQVPLLYARLHQACTGGF